MTKIRMNWEDMTLTASGHAGAGKYGQDIVCAAVSILLYALVNTLRDAEERGRVTLEWSDDPEMGNMRIHVKPRSGEEQKVRAYFKVTMMGLKTMAEYYPGNVSVGEVTAHGNL